MRLDKRLIKLINEEISEYDFLGSDKLNKEREYHELLSNDDFQLKLISDLLTNNNYKIIDVIEGTISGNYSTDYNDDQVNYISIEYTVKLEYLYDPNKEPITFELYFYNDEKIGFGLSGKSGYVLGADRMDRNEFIEDSWISDFEWDKIKIDIFTNEGDEITFKAFQKAQPKIKYALVRKFTENFLSKELESEFRDI